MALYPAINDSDADLLKKTAWNWYTIALDRGASSLTPPSLNDNRETLLKKICYYTASIA